MAKKSFSISADLAKGIRNSVHTGSQNLGQMHYDIMSIDVIKPDPNNPRKLFLTLEDVKNGIKQADPDLDIKNDEIFNLYSLVDSIKRVGVRNAIEVYKDGEFYRVISGERRLLAAILAGKQQVPVHICNKPDTFNLSYLQWIENIQREDLNLYEKYENLKQLVGSYQQNNESPISADVLARLLGISARQAYRYYNLLNAKEDMLRLIKNRKLNNLKFFNEISQLKDRKIRQQILQRIEVGDPAFDIRKLNDEHSIQKKDTLRHGTNKGRPVKHINLGRISNPNVIKRLIETIVSQQHFKEHAHLLHTVDWTSPKSISHGFRELLRVFEEQVKA